MTELTNLESSSSRSEVVPAADVRFRSGPRVTVRPLWSLTSFAGRRVGDRADHRIRRRRCSRKQCLSAAGWGGLGDCRESLQTDFVGCSMQPTLRWRRCADAYPPELT